MDANAPRAAGFVALLALAGALGGCSSPEAGRPRGGGPGGDGGNYVPGAVHPPSKIDGTRTYDAGTVRAR